LKRLKNKNAYLFTGFVVPGRYPQGENDGPLGTLALARALDLAGLIPTIWVDPQLMDDTLWLAAELGIESFIRPIDPDELDRLKHVPAVAIAIEKPGRNAQGIMHTFVGSPSPADRSLSTSYSSNGTIRRRLPWASEIVAMRLDLAGCATRLERFCPLQQAVNADAAGASSQQHPRTCFCPLLFPIGEPMVWLPHWRYSLRIRRCCWIPPRRDDFFKSLPCEDARMEFNDEVVSA